MAIALWYIFGAFVLVFVVLWLRGSYRSWRDDQQTWKVAQTRKAEARRRRMEYEANQAGDG